MPDSFQCTLITPQQQVLDEQVAYASVPAWDGLLGVAPSRAPLLVKLGDGPLRLDLAEGESRLFFLAGGFAQMNGDVLSLISEEAVAAEDIDRSQVEKDFQQTLQTKATGDEAIDERHLQVSRARMMMHVADLLESKAQT